MLSKTAKTSDGKLLTDCRFAYAVKIHIGENLTEKSLYCEYKALIKSAKHVSELNVCVVRNTEQRYVFSFVFPLEFNDVNYRMFERIIKSVIWIAGGAEILIEGRSEFVERLKSEYSENGTRAFDCRFMKDVFGSFCIKSVESINYLADKNAKLGFTLSAKGKRIGFDAGGSDRKTCALIDGKVIYSEEAVWRPKTCADYAYHKNEIKTAIAKALNKIGGVDYIGISTAGIVIDGEIKASSLFESVDKADFERYVRTIYKDVCKEFNVPVYIANDGDVAALSGIDSNNGGKLISLALGTSEAGGYVDKDGQITEMLNELAFVPIYSGDGVGYDEWSGDFGCGANYLSQNSIIRLAQEYGMRFNENSTPAEKLIEVRNLFDNGDERAKRVFEKLGTYIADAIAWYTLFYDFESVLLLGRVVSGQSGTTAIDFAEKALKLHYPELRIKIIVPKDSEDRRLAQCFTAAKMQRK